MLINVPVSILVLHTHKCRVINVVAPAIDRNARGVIMEGFVKDRRGPRAQTEKASIVRQVANARGAHEACHNHY